MSVQFSRGLKKEKPTYRQIEFAEKIAETLCLDLPQDYTKEAYSDFISEWSEDYYFEKGY